MRRRSVGVACGGDGAEVSTPASVAGPGRHLGALTAGTLAAGMGLLMGLGVPGRVEAAEGSLPRIAVFSGPTATIQNAYPLITGNKARRRHGLPLLNGPDDQPLAFERLYAQRLAAPVTVYIEAFSAHPLEADAAELYAPPDGYLDRDGRFQEHRTGPDDRPVYAVELRPEDGLYPLPYVARQRDGKAWDAAGAFPGAPFEQTRQTFYPDASRIFEEIERSGGSLHGRAEYHFYRPAPSGGYTKGLPAGRRTDHGSGDVAPERLGRDFFRYGEHRADAPRGRLAVATRIVQEAMASGRYAGGIWLEGSPNVEESAYWLNLLIDTTRPMVCHSAQRARGYLSADGDRNIVDGVQYILSGQWADERGNDRLGGVLIVDQVVFSAREVQKGDARPGGYVATGGFGGVLGSVGYDTTITFLPNRLHTHRSEVRTTVLPESVTGVRRDGNGIATRPVRVKDASGNLVPESIPNVSIVKGSRWRDPDPFANGDEEVEVLSRIEANLRSEALAGFVQEGVTGGGLTQPVQSALERAVFSGFPLVKVNRGNPEGFMRRNANDLYIEGGNLTATKARLLLMASLLKLGALPPAVDPLRPTEAERRAILGRIAEYQRIFDSH